ncbi:MAG: hypothetical protein Q9191_005117, partial [Dirinaria sp. TL-2023a]
RSFRYLPSVSHMAEPISLLVSAITLLNSTVGALNLLSKRKDVPRVVHGFHTQAKQLELILEIIRANDVLNSTHEPILQDILQNCTTDLRALDERLQVLAPKFNSKNFTKAWGTIKGQLGMREFEGLMRNIEGYKSTLMLFLQIQNQFVSAMRPKLEG